MLTYRFGSCALAHTADHLASQEIKWIGVKPSDAVLFNTDHDQLTNNDKHKLKSMFDRPYITSDIRKELEVLSESNRKVEIESFYKFSSTYLVDEFLNGMFRLNCIDDA